MLENLINYEFIYNCVAKSYMNKHLKCDKNLNINLTDFVYQQYFTN